MKYIIIIFLLAFLSSCANKHVLYTGKKYRYVGGNAAHFQKRAEIKAERKAMKELYGKQ